VKLHNIVLSFILQLLVHQVRYQLNPNYVIIIKQNIDKLLTTSFIQHVEEAFWLSLIVVVPNKNDKL
jgi:hypothetical protein